MNIIENVFGKTPTGFVKKTQNILRFFLLEIVYTLNRFLNKSRIVTLVNVAMITK